MDCRSVIFILYYPLVFGYKCEVIVVWSSSYLRYNWTVSHVTPGQVTGFWELAQLPCDWLLITWGCCSL